MADKVDVSVIIPAFNEEKTVAQVVTAARQCSLVSEVIVVDDGSGDQTAVRAEGTGARVIRQTSNQGKGQALQAGVQAAKGNYLVFVDADLIGLRPEHLEQMILPVREGGFDMSVGAIDRRRRWGSLFLRFFNHSRHPLAGTRVLKSDFWESIPVKYKRKYYVESAVSYVAKERSLRVKTVLLEGVSHLVKEKKHGLLMGLFSRFRMCGQVLWINIFLRFF